MGGVYTSKDALSESIDSSVLKHSVILALLTAISLQLTSLIFKLDEDLGQIVVFPLVLLAFIYLLRNFLPKILVQALLSTLILLIFSFLWTQGDFGIRGVSYISKRLLSSANPRLEQLRVEFNRDSEVLNFPKLETIYRNFDDASAQKWGEKSFRLLVYADVTNPHLKLFLGELSRPQTVDLNEVKLSIQLFPEWIPINPNGIPVDYLTTLTRVLPSLKQQKDEIQRLEDLGFAGYAAGLAGGKWNSPVPRAAALFLGASSNLAKGKNLGVAELTCIKRDLAAVIRKLRKTDSPELRALAMNNLAVANLLLSYKDQPNKALGFSRRLLSKATRIKSDKGEVVNGARLATANLFALDGAELRNRARQNLHAHRKHRALTPKHNQRKRHKKSSIPSR